MVAKSDEKKEYAAAEFIKWLTASEQNMSFVDETGYLPVTRKAFEEDMTVHLETIEDTRIIKMLNSVLSMYEEYTFFTAPTYADFDADSDTYEDTFKKLLTDDRAKHLKGESVSCEATLAQMIQ